MTFRLVPAAEVARGDHIWCGPAGWWAVLGVIGGTDLVAITCYSDDPRWEVEVHARRGDLIRVRTAYGEPSGRVRMKKNINKSRRLK